MHKYLTLCLLLLLPQLLQAQSDKNKWSFRLHAGYADNSSSNGVYSLGTNQLTGRDYNTDLSIGFHLSKRWECGVGFYYGRQDNRVTSSLYVPMEFYATEITRTKLNLFMWEYYLTGKFQIFKGLYFSPIMSYNSGHADETKGHYIFKCQEVLRPNTTFPSFENVLQDRYIYYNTYYYSSIAVMPAFTFYINNHFALNLQTGIFSISMIDDDFSSRSCLADINPSSWRLGLVFSL